ncbi:MAG: L,D-transpeptidase family protein [Patescibacteria group bacterium]|jgi:hypothetical protein
MIHPFHKILVIICLAAGGMLLISLAPSAGAADDYDRDGYSDEEEIAHNYSPFNPKQIRADKSDMDSDGLSDLMEWRFKTDPFRKDSDGDGYSDFQELDLVHNPLSTSTKKLASRIEINLKKQELTYFIGGQAWRRYLVSTGKASMPTPSGKFLVTKKVKKAWSGTYKLWMPYWLGLGSGSFGIHELPLWPSGYREGEDHLGKPVSHGCIRLGIGPAQYLFDRVATGTEVTIKRE